MDTNDAVFYACTSFAVTFVTTCLLGFILDTMADSYPLHANLLCHFILCFVLLAVCFVHLAYARDPGTWSWRYQLPDTEEASDCIKLLVFWWLVVFLLAVFLEGVVLGKAAFPFIMGWREETCDDPEFVPVLTRLIRAMDDMARDALVAFREDGLPLPAFILFLMDKLPTLEMVQKLWQNVVILGFSLLFCWLLLAT